MPVLREDDLEVVRLTSSMDMQVPETITGIVSLIVTIEVTGLIRLKQDEEVLLITIEMSVLGLLLVLDNLGGHPMNWRAATVSENLTSIQKDQIIQLGGRGMNETRARTTSGGKMRREKLEAPLYHENCPPRV